MLHSSSGSMATVSNLNPNNPVEDIVSPSPNLGNGLGSTTPASPMCRQNKRSSDELTVREADVLKPTKKLKIKEEEDATKDEGFCGDDDSVSSRLARLAEIVRILEKFDLFLEKADASPPTLDEQRICHLIYSHVNSYIFLYYLENKINNHPTDKGETLEIPLEEKKLEVLIDGRDLEQTMWETALGGMLFGAFLEACRTSLRSGEAENTQASGIYLHLEPVYNESQRLREQQLLDALHTLEVIGEWRDYSPPSAGEEIQGYRTIRKYINSSLARISAKHTAQGLAGKPRWRMPNISHPHGTPTESQDFFFFFPGHRLAVAFELIPEYRAFLQECKHRVSRIFSGHRQDAAKGDTANIAEHDRNVAPMQLIRWEPKKTVAGIHLGSSTMTRLECLKLIGARLKCLGSFGDEPPTHRETRLCTMIAEHIRSSLLLFANSSSFIPEANKPSCQVYIGDVSAHSDLSRAQGEGTREQVLDQIMSFVKAFKSSCLAEMPTKEEAEVYWDLWKMLRPILMACLGSDIPQAELISIPVNAMAKRNLLSVYKSLVGFFEELRAEFREILNILIGATLSTEGLSLNEVLDCSTEGRKNVEAKLREFFEKPVPGRIEQLDQTVQTLGELELFGVVIFNRMGDAINAIDAEWHDEKVQIVAEEVKNALQVISSEKLFGI